MGIQQPEEAHRIWAETFNKGDADALAELYEEDAVLTLNGQTIAGRGAIQDTLASLLLAAPSIEIETKAVIESSEGVALLHGRWAITGIAPDGSAMNMSGRNTEVLRRQPDGTWQFLIDNPNSPE